MARRKKANRKSLQNWPASKTVLAGVIFAGLLILFSVSIITGRAADTEAKVDGLMKHSEAEKYETARGSYYIRLREFKDLLVEGTNDIQSNGKLKIGEASTMLNNMQQDFVFMCSFVFENPVLFSEGLYNELGCDFSGEIFACLSDYVGLLSSYDYMACSEWLEGYTVVRERCGFAFTMVEMNASDLRGLCLE